MDEIIKEKICELKLQLRRFISRDWQGQFPNLRDILEPIDIYCLLAGSMKDDDVREVNSLIDFVISTGYKDEPELDEDGGRPLWRRTTPVHSAILQVSSVVRKLFRIYDRVDVNYTDNFGLTHFHVACMSGCMDVVEKFLDLGQDPNHLYQLTGESPLLLALMHHQKEVAALLLRRGADPNLTDKMGSTALHVICRNLKLHDDGMAKALIELSSDEYKPVQVDARDDFCQTPLQLAVINFVPDVIEVLLDHGADLSSFVFPTEAQLDLRFKRIKRYSNCFKLIIASSALSTVEILDKRGYKLDRSDTLIIMKFFAKHGLLETSAVIEKYWSDNKFARRAKKIRIKDDSDLSLYELIQLRPEEAATKRLTYSDYYEFALMDSLRELRKGSRSACTSRLCEMISRQFFRRWTLESFLKLTQYRLPILCCEIIIEKLMNIDLCNIRLATEDQIVEQSQ